MRNGAPAPVIPAGQRRGQPSQGAPNGGCAGVKNPAASILKVMVGVVMWRWLRANMLTISKKPCLTMGLTSLNQE